MANDLNRVDLIGRLVRDCEVKTTTSGTPVSRFSIAVGERRKNGETWEDEINYFDVALFGKSADALKPYLTKGRQVAVMGKLKQDRWEKDGKANSRVYVLADNLQLLAAPSENPAQSKGTTAPAPAAGAQKPTQAPQSPQNAAKPTPAPAPAPAEPVVEEQGTFDDVIPF